MVVISFLYCRHFLGFAFFGVTRDVKVLYSEIAYATLQFTFEACDVLQLSRLGTLKDIYDKIL